MTSGNNVSPKKRAKDNIDDDNISIDEVTITKRGFLFWINCFGSGQSSPERPWERIRCGGDHDEDTWWSRGWTKIQRELKTFFVRHFCNKNDCGGGGGGYRRCENTFSYDAGSYSRNFDDGPGHFGQLDDDYLYRDFSYRYASIPASIVDHVTDLESRA